MKQLFYLFLLLVPASLCAQRLGITELKRYDRETTWGVYTCNDNSFFVAPDMNFLRIWDNTANGYVKGKQFTGGQPEKEYFRFVGISPDGTYIAAGSDASRVYVFRKTAAGFKK